MEKVHISFWEGTNRGLVGLNIYEDENIEVRKVIEFIRESSAKCFPGTEITRAKAVRELLGERE